MGAFGTFLRECFVMELPRSFWIKTEIELILPAEFKAGLRQGVVAVLRARMALRKVGCVCRDFVSDDAILHILLVWKPEVLLGCHIAKHRAAIPTDHGSSDAAGDVVVARRDVGG